MKAKHVLENAYLVKFEKILIIGNIKYVSLTATQMHLITFQVVSPTLENISVYCIPRKSNRFENLENTQHCSICCAMCLLRGEAIC